LYLSIRRLIKQIVVITEAHNFVNYVQNFIHHPAIKVNSIRIRKFRDHQCRFRRNRSTTDHIFCFRQILETKWAYSEAVHQLCVDFQKAYDSVRREVPYNILIEFDIPMKLARLIKMCLNETCSRCLDRQTCAFQLCFRVRY
jgi:hypothetical protein